MVSGSPFTAYMQRVEREQQQRQMMQAINHKHQAYFNGTAVFNQEGTTTGDTGENKSEDKSSGGQYSSNAVKRESHEALIGHRQFIQFGYF
eukprot:IDg18639t1